MKVFTFFLMMAVAAAGTLVGYRVITGKDLVNPADFGLGAQASAPSAVAGARAAATATPQPVPTARPTLSPTPTRVPDTTKVMLVGNTDGQGAYLRRTPHMEDKLQAWRDGARMEVVGDPVDGDGRKWRKVRTPDGVEGYIPQEFLVDAP